MSNWKKRYQQKQQQRKVPSNRAALEEARFFREQNTELTERTRHLINALSKWDIDVSCDGLRHFWSIELTESGRMKRDRACKAEEENARLREYIEWLEGWALSDPNAMDIEFEIEMKQRELGIKGD